MTEDPILGPWLRGRLALAGIGLRADIGVWLDAVYALCAEAPEGRVLERLADRIETKAAMIRPEEARATWGQTPVQRALAGQLGRGAGVQAGGTSGAAPGAATVRERVAAIEQRNRARRG